MNRLRSILLVSTALVAQVAFAAEGTFHRTLNVSGTADIEVTSGSGNIVVHSGEPGKVVITGHVKSSYNFFGGDSQEKVDRIVNNPPIEQNGNWVRIGKLQGDRMQDNVSISYDVVVPRDTRLKANTGSGELRIDDIDGSTIVHTGSGSIHAHNLGSDVEAHAGSGDIDASNIKGGARVGTGSGSIHVQLSGNGYARVSAGSGEITVENVRSSLDASTGSGEVRVSGSPLDAWNIRTGSGDVRLNLDHNAKFNLYARSSSGSVHSDLPITMSGSLERHTIRGTVNGGGPSVEVHTGSGSIDIR